MRKAITNQTAAATMAIGHERANCCAAPATISSNVPPRKALQISSTENSRACSSTTKPASSTTERIRFAWMCP